MGNLTHATKKLDEIIGTNRNNLDTMLVIDAVKTLTAVDTGKLLWGRISNDGEDPLKTLFSSPMGLLIHCFSPGCITVRKDS